MKRSTDRILTTHTGSLPRPSDLVDMLRKLDAHEPLDGPAFQQRVRTAVAETVAAQRNAGIDVLNDGEEGKVGYSTYIKDRCTGFEGENRSTMVQAEGRDFPDWAEARARPTMTRPACNGPIAWKDFDAVKRDIDNLAAAAKSSGAEEVFMSSASPGVIAAFLTNEYYPSEDAYLDAIANVMQDEYRAIVDAGFILQLDCPDLAMTRHNRHADKTLPEFRKIVERNIEVLNQATKDIPADRMRVHLCWGNYEGPHQLDVELKDIIDLVLKARAEGISFEGANPRHENEWRVFRDVKLPDGQGPDPRRRRFHDELHRAPGGRRRPHRALRFSRRQRERHRWDGLRLRHLRRWPHRLPRHCLGQAGDAIPGRRAGHERVAVITAVSPRCWISPSAAGRGSPDFNVQARNEELQ